MEAFRGLSARPRPPQSEDFPLSTTRNHFKKQRLDRPRKPQEPTAEPHASPGGSAPLPVAPGPLSPEAAAAPGAAEGGAPEPGDYAIEEVE